MKEDWGTVEGFSNYRISSLGRIYRLGRTVIKKFKNGRVVQMYVKGGLVPQFKNKNNKYGYYRVRLVNDNGEGCRRYVHRLVAEAHHPDFAPHLEVDHRGSREENVVHLLECVTRKENMKRMHEDNPHVVEKLRVMSR